MALARFGGDFHVFTPPPAGGRGQGWSERSELLPVQMPTPLRLGSKLPSLAAPPACGREYEGRNVASHQRLGFVVHRAGDVARLEDHVGVRRARRDHREAVGELGDAAVDDRSEEHKSELQSLMRNSYAVSRFKK